MKSARPTNINSQVLVSTALARLTPFISHSSVSSDTPDSNFHFV